jgi:hypothetical protein
MLACSDVTRSMVNMESGWGRGAEYYGGADAPSDRNNLSSLLPSHWAAPSASNVALLLHDYVEHYCLVPHPMAVLGRKRM